jgi:hypothetical protein
MVPALLLAGNRPFGFSSNLRHLCAACLRPRPDYFRYDVRRDGGWNLAFLAGTAAGALLCAVLIGVDDVPLAAATRAELAALGIRDFAGLVPDDLLSWGALVTLKGFIAILVGGFLVGFGTAWAGGCTSGHGVSGLADLQLPSLIAVIGFFAGGCAATYWLLPWLLRL